MVARPPIPLTPFKRQRIYDGLLITADSWQQTQRYQRQRQGFHYQTLSQGGIVEGLGVSLRYPGSEEAELGRWLVIQPGAALDALGNPIIVPTPQYYDVKIETRRGTSQTIYVVASYVDPDYLNAGRTVGGRNRDSGVAPFSSAVEQAHLPPELEEQFRIVAKTELSPLDVELCRIQLSAGQNPLRLPRDVMASPVGWDVLDLHHRQSACLHMRESLRIAQITDGSDLQQAMSDRLTDLHAAIPALYPGLHDPSTPSEAPLNSLSLNELVTADLQPYSLLYCPYNLLLSSSDQALLNLKSYLSQGGVVLVTVEFETLELEGFLEIQADLNRALDSLDDEDGMYEQLLEELTAVEIDIVDRIQTVRDSIAETAEVLDVLCQGNGDLARDHPLRRYPFLFGQFPELQGQPIDVRNWGGLVLMVGNLAHHWGLDENLTISRDVLRTAQEFGINILHFAHHRRRLTQLLLSHNSSYSG